MKFFRNPDVKKQIIIYIVLVSVLATIGLYIGFDYMGFMLASAGAAIAISMVFTYIRYNKISQMSVEIDDILNGKDNLSLSRFEEGELAILQDSVAKLTIRLREQAHALKQDKIYLADSIADISHQIRTPLTSVNLIVSLLMDADISADRRRELLGDLNKLLSRIDWLIASLLKMSKLDAGTAVFSENPVCVRDLIEKSASIIAVPLELRSQTVEFDIGDNIFFTGDILWSIEAVGNILKNCMEHTPAGGKIFIEAEENAIYTQIIIRDTGSGIDKEDLPHLFERFYKGKDSGEQSVGIGLALSRMIITRQNGTIRAGNDPGGGARFTVRFYKGIV